MKQTTLLLGLCFLAAGCDDGVSATSGLGEPIRVRGGQFFEGAIPGATGGPEVATIDSQNNLVTQGQAGKKLAGVAKKGSTAVAARLEDLGTGYWIVPVGPEDPQTEGDLSWEMVIDYSTSARPGKHSLVLAASDQLGTFGPTRDLPILIQSLTPEGAAGITLSWDSNADLDLHVIGPNGKEADPKHLTTAFDVDGGLPPGAGAIDRDANAGCGQNGYRSETLVFVDPPAPGTYQIRVDMFDACSASAANFVVSARRAGTSVFSAKGRLLDLDADGGGPGSGLFVGEATFQ
jgi:hypothetical protein